ncbi:glycosyltransferase family 4 protein [Bowmanella yangjiangensis]|uniref:glycosyltransferase family 4 protein n=1 Tax=Bowmanella yangjiangensis TaxID=2811230 RepID=UPI001E4D3178|nr:glycosyltransferase family 4 protein [Bowmanella yangjiangensis]
MALRILTFTSLFPNSEQPRLGVFIENRLRELRRYHPDVVLHVVAPVPWFPIKSNHFGEYGKMARVEKQAIRDGVQVYYPRYPVLPKIGMNLAPFLMALWMLPFLRKLQKQGVDFDLIDSHFFYPDGAAAVWLGKRLGKPVAVTARGSDIHLYPTFPWPRRVIQWTLRNSQLPVAVCKALADEMQQIEPAAKKVLVARNGVNLEHFAPETQRELLRQRLGLERYTLLSVGNLIELKGHHFVIETLVKLPECQLCIIGDGPWRQQLQSLAESLGVAERVRFTGLLNRQQLRDYYAAADIMVLASSREGWANVLLESMACGTPVVATAIWGTPEVVASPEAGCLASERSVDALTDAIQSLMQAYPLREDVRRYAENFSWEATSQLLFEHFGQLVESQCP